MNIPAKSGAALASAAAALILAGSIAAPAAYAANHEKGHCMGANACKGTSACKSANNACKGQNACKGKGFTEATEKECAAIKDAKFEKK